VTRYHPAMPELTKLFFPRASLADYLSKHPDAQLVWIGYRIFKWLLLLTVAIMIALGVYAALTYPTMSDIKALLPNGVDGDPLVKLTKEMRAAWMSDVKDLAQNFLLTPVFPLLAAVVGYIFGRSHSVNSVPGEQRTASEQDVRNQEEPRT